MQTEGRRLEREAAGAADQLAVRLRVLDEARPSVRLLVDARAVGPGGRAVNDLASADVEALALNIVVEAEASAHDDLKAIMQDVQSTAVAKSRVRDYLGTSAATHLAIGAVTAGAAPGTIGTTDLDSVLAILLTAYGIDIGHEVEAPWIQPASSAPSSACGSRWRSTGRARRWSCYRTS